MIPAMRTIRLYADVPLEPGTHATLPTAPATHAFKVLRLQAGDAVTLFNGDGHEYRTRLVVADAREVRAEVLACESPPRESPLRITLVQALARGEKMDWVIQKATELGVARIVPVATERSEVKLDAERAAKRLEHWRAIAIAACEQCGRNTLPRMEAPCALAAWLEHEGAADSTHRWMLCPDDASLRLRDLRLDPAAALAVAIGPEGGFGGNDFVILRAQGFRELALGPRILRTETAGITVLAALQSMFGDA